MISSQKHQHAAAKGNVHMNMDKALGGAWHPVHSGAGPSGARQVYRDSGVISKLGTISNHPPFKLAPGSKSFLGKMFVFKADQ